MSEQHTILGLSVDGEYEIALTREERLRHMALFGMTGVGKTTLLSHIIAQDAAQFLIFDDKNVHRHVVVPAS